MTKKLYAILIEDKYLKDSPYFYMSAGDELNQGRCFIYTSKDNAEEAKKCIEEDLDLDRKVIIKTINL